MADAPMPDAAAAAVALPPPPPIPMLTNAQVQQILQNLTGGFNALVQAFNNLQVNLPDAIATAIHQPPPPGPFLLTPYRVLEETDLLRTPD